MADMIVSGAGSTDVNGTYVDEGTTSGGKPIYFNRVVVPSGALNIQWISTYWCIKFYASEYYKSTDNVATPDLCTTWTKGAGGTLPVPTVTAASQNYTLTCAAGSYSLTGTNADLTVTRHYTLTCEAGNYALTGTDVTLTTTVKQNFTLACSAGSYSLTGTDVTLTVQRNYTLTC